ncbi:hypothetical protein [Methyloterricola oryzae]|uniref:hypothetical protein n=1 Tax=Methyloterricola oryzae TaxID=1495050 RepID=UPI001301967F|nr:hypothetical protein [Methyloterricola oryzae]
MAGRHVFLRIGWQAGESWPGAAAEQTQVQQYQAGKARPVSLCSIAWACGEME